MIVLEFWSVESRLITILVRLQVVVEFVVEPFVSFEQNSRDTVRL